MSLVIHHLQHSQSERVVWLCEELAIPYELKTYRRDPKTLLGPPELKAVQVSHPNGTAPVMEDGDVKITESSAIMEYIITKHGSNHLKLPPTSPHYADAVFWFFWAIGTLQPAVSTPMFIHLAGVDPSQRTAQSAQNRLTKALQSMDARLREYPYLAGDEFTAADIYAAFTVSTMRLFSPFPLTGYDGIVQWLHRLSERPAYKAVMEKAEKGEERGVVPTIMVEAPAPMWAFAQK